MRNWPLRPIRNIGVRIAGIRVDDIRLDGCRVRHGIPRVVRCGIVGRRRSRRLRRIPVATGDRPREARAMRAFEHLLRQFSELLDRRPRGSVHRREIVARRAGIAITLGERKQAAQSMRSLVQPLLQRHPVDEGGVVGQDQTPCEVVEIRQQIDGHETERRGDEQRQLDRLHVEIFADAGFGQQVREAMDQRREHHIDQGDASRSRNGRIFYRRNLLATLREREVASVGAEIAVSKALPFRAATNGETVSGKFTGTVQLSSGKFAVVEQSHEFTLVPWRSVIDRQLGREVIALELKKPGVTLMLLWEEYRAVHPGGYGYTYAEATWTQALPDWIGAHVRMFNFFGGVPRLIVPDNLKSGVNHASFYDPEINRSYGMMASHYGVGVLPARPRRPKDKAKVENGVRFAQTCILGRL